MRTQFLLLATLASIALTTAANPVPQDGGEQNKGEYTEWTAATTTTTADSAAPTSTNSEVVPTFTEAASASTVTESATSTDSATSTYSTDAAAWSQVADLVDNAATAVAEVTASASAESTAAAEPTQVYEGGETKENSVVAGEQKSDAIRASASAAAAAIVALYGAGIVLV